MPQELSQGILFSAMTPEHLEYLGVTVKEFNLLPEEVYSPAGGNHSFVTYTFVRDIAILSTARQPSLRFSMCANKRCNDCIEVGPIKNEKTGNSLIFRGTLPNLVTRFEGHPNNSMSSCVEFLAALTLS